MPAAARRPASFEVVFDGARLGEDLAHASAAGRAVALAARRRLARDGITASSLHPCEPQGRDARLPGCVKTYLPTERAAPRAGGAPGTPLGAWGMIFAVRADTTRRVYLECVAFGERHPQRASRPSVYEVAGRRPSAL